MSSSSESEVVEIMPLPSNPTIGKGEKQSFLKVQELVNLYLDVTSPRWSSYSMGLMNGDNQTEPELTITFQEIIGVHYLTVVKADETTGLMRWLEDFLEAEGYTWELPSNLEELLSYYIQNEMSFFVIDMINSNSTVKTVDPLIYKFNTSKVYYPLRISSLFSGNTDIALFTITSKELNDDSILSNGFVKKAQFQIKQKALAEISTNLTKLFLNDPYLCYFKFSGSLNSFKSDVLTDFQSTLDITTVTLATLSLSWVLVSLFFFLPTVKGLWLRDIPIPITRRLQITALSAGALGLFLAWSGYIFPWGLVELGKNEELLLTLNGWYVTFLSGKTTNLLFSLLLIATIPCYVYLLLIRGDSRSTSVAFAIIGASMMFIVLASCISFLYRVRIGTVMTFTGCLFITLGGLLCFLRTNLNLEHSTTITK